MKFHPSPDHLPAVRGKASRRSGAVMPGVLAALSVALAGCQSVPQQTDGVATGPGGCKPLGGPPPARNSNNTNAVIGAAIGAIGGAAIGSSVADRSSVGARNGALLGAMTGALAGSQYNSMIGLSQQSDGSVKLNIPGAVLFRTNSAEVNPAFQQTLGQVAQTIREYCGVTARVTGHTDSTGTPARNQQLSEERAMAVVSALRAMNVDSSRLSSEGNAARMPVASNADEAGRAQNRRVEIFVRPPN